MNSKLKNNAQKSRAKITPVSEAFFIRKDQNLPSLSSNVSNIKQVGTKKRYKCVIATLSSLLTGLIVLIVIIAALFMTGNLFKVGLNDKNSYNPLSEISNKTIASSNTSSSTDGSANVLCSLPRYTWSSISSKCLLTYGQTTCSSDLDCNDSENLICRANDCNCPNLSLIGMCDCKRNNTFEEYWNGTSCTSAKAYEYPCSADYECKTLGESTVCLSGKCQCSDSSLWYWDGLKCENKKVYNEQCLATYQCLDSQMTQCNGFQCVCKSTEYFNGFKCTSRVGELSQCNNDLMCQSPMTCNSSQICVCGMHEYYENITSVCNQKHFYSFYCDSDLQCRSDLGLVCMNNKCSCEPTRYTWSPMNFKCLLTYAQKFCTINSDCNESENLICSSNSCNCPTSSSIGMCDCRRTFGMEEYWDQTKCSTARFYGDFCTVDYQCQTLTQKTVCSGGTCKCANTSTEYFDGIQCVVKRKYLEPCSTNSECLDSELTNCNSFYCACSIHEYFSIPHQRCVPRVGELQSCYSNEMCLMAMICNTTHCLCPGLQYYENTTSVCIDQLTFNGYCNRDLECRNDLGLVCLYNRCVCSYRYSWSSFNNKCQLTYGQKFCSNDFECNSNENLKCVIFETNLCNCPTASMVGMCDCSRVFGAEEYWNGITCTRANMYGDSCTSDYECQTKTQKTICLNYFCLCSNPNFEFWNGIECTPKRRHLEQCWDDSHCLSSDLTSCIKNMCECGYGRYYNEIEQRCVSRLSEFFPCFNNTMCFEAMVCQSFQCKCPGEAYFSSLTLTCHPKKSYNFDCFENKECSEMRGLSCQNGKCLCSDPSKTWDSSGWDWYYLSGPQCKLTYSQVGCTVDTDCNQAENLFCRNDSSSRCLCPSNRTGSICDCKRNSTYEEYWDGSKCTVARMYGMSCNYTYQCQTLTQETVCFNNSCQCYGNGGFSKDKCYWCTPDEVYFDGYCYYFSNKTEVCSAIEAEKACHIRGSYINSYGYSYYEIYQPAIIYSFEVRNFFAIQLNGTARYWIRSRDKLDGWNDVWRNSGNQRIIRELCPYDYNSGELYMSFDPVTDCFNNNVKYTPQNLFNYACQRSVGFY